MLHAKLTERVACATAPFGQTRKLCVRSATPHRSVRTQAINSPERQFAVAKEAVAAFCGAALFTCCQPALADLNKYEAEAGPIYQAYCRLSAGMLCKASPPSSMET